MPLHKKIQYYKNWTYKKKNSSTTFAKHRVSQKGFNKRFISSYREPPERPARVWVG